jgi:hypothetical protein
MRHEKPPSNSLPDSCQRDTFAHRTVFARQSGFHRIREKPFAK